MSLILEALRKSEAERRRGQAPDLRTELPPVALPRVHAPPRWSWAVPVVALLALAWLLLARPGTAPSNHPSPAPAATAAPASPAETAESTGSMAAVARDAAPYEPGARIVIESVPGVPPRDTTAAPRQDAAPPTRLPAPDVSGGAGPGPAPVAEGAIAPSTAAASLPAPVPPPATTAVVASMPTTKAASPDARLLALSNLSPEERRQLPPLKLSMHMWSEDPARRFVILDGQRLAEGDRAGPAVVDAIRSDDVVLAWNGMRLRLSLR